MLEELGLRVPRIQGRWRGENVEDDVEMPMAYLDAHLPAFDRAPLGRNRLKDIILRRDDGLPVAVVSKSYLLIQHHDIVEAIAAATKAAGIAAGDLRAHLTLTEYGTRMALRVILPPQYSLRDASGHQMALRFECFNSVDGTVPLFALVGWFRFVCRNGLAVGTTTARVWQKHIPAGAGGADFAALLVDGIRAATVDRDAFSVWAHTPVSRESLQRWVDGPVASAWGQMAAAHVYSIARTGFDGVPERTRGLRPHLRPVSRALAVPGSGAPCEDCYAAAQILAWIASRRSNVAERSGWRAQIGQLVQQLAASSPQN